MRHATLILALILAGCATDDLPGEESGGEDESDVSMVAPTHDPENCPGGSSGGGGGADPNPIPAPRDCSQEASLELCLDCCDWNVDNVWGARCHRIPKKNKNERRRCWEDAERRRSDCQLMCPRGPILTIEALP